MHFTKARTCWRLGCSVSHISPMLTTDGMFNNDWTISTSFPQFRYNKTKDSKYSMDWDDTTNSADIDNTDTKLASKCNIGLFSWMQYKLQTLCQLYVDYLWMLSGCCNTIKSLSMSTFVGIRHDRPFLSSLMLFTDGHLTLRTASWNQMTMPNMIFRHISQGWHSFLSLIHTFGICHLHRLHTHFRRLL